MTVVEGGSFVQFLLLVLLVCGLDVACQTLQYSSVRDCLCGSCLYIPVSLISQNFFLIEEIDSEGEGIFTFLSRAVVILIFSYLFLSIFFCLSLKPDLSSFLVYYYQFLLFIFLVTTRQVCLKEFRTLFSWIKPVSCQHQAHLYFVTSLKVCLKEFRTLFLWIKPVSRQHQAHLYFVTSLKVLSQILSVVLKRSSSSNSYIC